MAISATLQTKSGDLAGYTKMSSTKMALQVYLKNLKRAR
jgi:hypothetical protein